MGFGVSKTAIFAVGWSAYAATFMLRKPLSLIKADLDFDNEFSTLQLGLIDMAFLLPFCFGQIFLGYLGDRKNARELLFICMVASALPAGAFFAMANQFTPYFLMLMLMGIFQAPIWCLISRVVGQVFTPDYRHTIYGLLNAASFVGGIVGTLLTVYVQYKLGWIFVYVIPGILSVVFACFAYAFFRDPVQGSANNDSDKESLLDSHSNRWNAASSASIQEFIANRHISSVALSLFAVKLVRYTIYMWVPYFLLDEILYAQLDSGLISIAFEGGGILGSVAIGYMADRIFCRRPVLCAMVCNLLTALAIKLFYTLSYHVVHAILWLLVIGFFNCAADSLLFGSIPAAIGESLNSPAAVVGYVNGVGTLGAIIEGPLFSFFLMLGGWDVGFLFCVILSAVGSTVPLLFYPGFLSSGGPQIGVASAQTRYPCQ